MDDVTKDKLSINVQNSLKMASNWVMAAAGVMWAAYLALPLTCDGQPAASGCVSQHDLQAWVSSTLHVPPVLVPLLTAALGITARIWPQKSITPAVAEAKSEDAPQPADDTGSSKS